MANSAGLRLGLPKDKFFKAGLFVAVLQGLSAVALLGVSAWLISRAAEVNSIVYLGLAIVGVRGFAVGRATFRYVERLLLHESAFRMLGEKRPRIFRAIAPFIPAGLSNRSRGETISRVVSDVEELQNLSLRVIAPLVQAVVVALASVAVVSLLLPSAGIALALTLLAAFFIAIPASSWIGRHSDELVSPLRARLAQESLDLLENQDVYLAYGWMNTRRQELAATAAELRKAQSRTGVSAGLGLALFSLFASIAMITGAWFGGLVIEANQLPGALLAVLILLPMAVFEVVQNVQPVASSWRRYRVSANRISELLDQEIPIALQINDGERCLEVMRDFEILNGAVRYPNADIDAVTNVNLKVSSGEFVMVSGESGSGKSTLALVLTRMLNLSAGSYKINGRNAESYSTLSIRQTIGYLEQNPMVFVGDVRANLLLAKTDASDTELISVLRRVGLWQMFSEREGLATYLGDRGVAISGGEAQRLALARAILANFQVLILDEPTANVDRETADVLVGDLLSIAKADHRTVILISHEDRYRELVDREVHLN